MHLLGDREGRSSSSTPAPSGAVIGTCTARPGSVRLRLPDPVGIVLETGQLKEL
ncbi:hypothetical protein V1L54_10690 [Streptomyces sp. TRM 70361]|uniref:hypothetical protein n=1 Tax=Streptomyces sp. TRM 70361 TaxID=3116553 RepID=UPI002E7BEF97|nr:hypothetical protein [Streptomyces sp. TRM 70361]MEE1939867.1 hypothetical protein [Streptomyces sp. TRM 70361]